MGRTGKWGCACGGKHKTSKAAWNCQNCPKEFENLRAKGWEADFENREVIYLPTGLVRDKETAQSATD